MKRWAASILLLVLPAQAEAQSSLDTEHYSCDAPAGAFSLYQRPIGTGSIKLNTLVQINQLRKGTNWQPVVNVMLNGGGRGKEVGLRLIVDPTRDMAVLFAVFPGVEFADAKPLGEAKLHARLVAEISANEAETRLTVNGTSLTGTPLTGARWTMRLSCSSIDAHITDIAVKEG